VVVSAAETRSPLSTIGNACDVHARVIKNASSSRRESLKIKFSFDRQKILGLY